MKYPQPVLNHVLVKVSSEKKNKISHGSLELVASGTEGLADISTYAQTLGHVVNVPRGMSKGVPYGYIVPEVKIGDDVVMHFASIDEESMVEINGENLYLVPYEYIFAVIRDSKIVMIGGRVLCEAIQQEGVINEDGMNVMKTASGIIYAINVPHDGKFATLSHIGNPVTDRKELQVKLGEAVMYSKDADFENEINGKKYFCMIQEDLLLHEPKTI